MFLSWFLGKSLKRSSQASLDLPSIWYLSHTTFPIIGSYFNSSLICIRQFLEKWHNEGIRNVAFGTNFNSLRLICDHLTKGGYIPRKSDEQLGRSELPEISSETAGPLKFGLHSIVSSFPSDEADSLGTNKIRLNRQGTIPAQVELLLIETYSDLKSYRYSWNIEDYQNLYRIRFSSMTYRISRGIYSAIKLVQPNICKIFTRFGDYSLFL